MSLSRISPSDIDSRANQLLEKHNMENAVPVDVEDLARREGIRILPKTLDDDISGFLIHKVGRTTVVVNDSHAPVRRRFTVAHELGHFTQHVRSDVENVFVDPTVYFRNEVSSSGERIREIEANKFAAALLMPATAVRKQIANLDEEIGSQLVVKLAEAFGVSQAAMGYRLVNLGYLTRYSPEQI